jgi:putative oxidoreductase
VELQENSSHWLKFLLDCIEFLCAPERGITDSVHRRNSGAKRYQNFDGCAIVLLDRPLLFSTRRFLLWLRYTRYFVFLRRNLLRYLDRLQPLALLVARLTLGAIMVAHGYQNLFRHLHDHVHVVTGFGFPAWLGYVSSFSEFLGGLLVLAGFVTRAAAFAICIDLAVAIWKVHWHNGLTGALDRPGFEFPMAVFALAFALIFFGAGPIAFDHVLRGGGSGPAKR